MSYHKLKNIAVSENNYLDLNGLGKAVHSFHEVITETLKAKMLQSDSRVVPGNQTATGNIQHDYEKSGGIS